jgi:non-specific protein-tyrosine kinase
LDVDLRQLLRSAQRWWWLIVAIPLATGVLAFVYTSRQTPLYLAEASLQVTTSAQTDDDLNVLLGFGQKAENYRLLVGDPSVLEPAGASVDPPVDSVTLGKQVKSRTSGSLLFVGVSDPDPARAATLANAVAGQLAAVVQARVASGIEQNFTDYQVRIDQVDGQIAERQAEIDRLTAAGDAASQSQIAGLTEEIDRLKAQIAALQVEQATVLAGGGDELSPFTTARAPLDPYAPRKALNLLLGLFAGAILAAGIVLILEYLDNTVKASVDFPALVGGPLLTSVRMLQRMKPGRGQLFVLEDPKGSAAESIRLLRTNVEFASATRELVAIGVTSSNPGEGKSTVAANLAVALAQAGFETALIDADLRRPTQHRIFDLTNDRGLSTLLTYHDRRGGGARTTPCSRTSTSSGRPPAAEPGRPPQPRPPPRPPDRDARDRRRHGDRHPARPRRQRPPDPGRPRRRHDRRLPRRQDPAGRPQAGRATLIKSRVQ